MLKTHFDLVEKMLLATSEVVTTAGHNLHKGLPREAFVREFLREHLSNSVGLGTGEIIDAQSGPGEKRNQIDLVLYDRDLPEQPGDVVDGHTSSQ